MRSPPAAAALLLLAAGFLAGCPGGGKDAAKPGPGPAATGAPGLDPAVVVALSKRPDLAKGRVYILGLDGCDPRIVRSLVAKGRLPHFKRLMDEGAFGFLQSQTPMLSPLLWTTVSTGKFPTEHGVLDFLVRSRTDPKGREAVTGRNRQVESMWDIAGRYGRQVGVVGWLASHPAEQVNGFAVSERTELLAYLFNEGIAPSDEGKTYPPGLLAEVAPLRRRPADITYEEAKEFLHVTPEEWKAACVKDEFTAGNRTNNLRLILTGADNFRRVGARLWKEHRPALFCAYFEMLDAVSHNFMAFREPVTWVPRDLAEVQAFMRARGQIDPAAVERVWKWARGEGPREGFQGLEPETVSTIAELSRGAHPEDVAKWKDAVDAAYDWTDRLLGEVMASCDADTTLLVVSDHGFASGPAGSPLDSPKPPFDSAFQSRIGGASYHLPNGVLAAWGRGVRKGFQVPLHEKGPPPSGARLVDVAPTALALLGFPKAKDMPGRVVSEVFDLDLVVGAVDSYEAGRSERLARESAEAAIRDGGTPKGKGAPGAGDDDEFVQQLMAVGYVGTAEEGPTRALLHMAASYEEQGRWAEAEEASAEALKVAKGPQRAEIHLRLGRLRKAQKDLEGARKRYEDALKENPSFVPALVSLAKLAEDMEDPAAAIAAWEKLLALDPKSAETKIRLANALRSRSDRSPESAGEDLRRAVALIKEAMKPVEEGGTAGPAAVTAQGHNYVGRVLLRVMDYGGAMEHFKKAAQMDPGFLPARTSLGVLHLNLANQFRMRMEVPSPPPETAERMKQNRAEALRWFGEVLEKAPPEGGDRARALYNRAEVHWYIPPRDLAAAEKDLSAALKADPGYKRAQALLDKVRQEMGSK
jgi:tetratricopeptide (TPR) repeat protein